MILYTKIQLAAFLMCCKYRNNNTSVRATSLFRSDREKAEERPLSGNAVMFEN